jgi:8-oxo-dGTP pyrophosphatase MutT (NUDIX family)
MMMIHENMNRPKIHHVGRRLLKRGYIPLLFLFFFGLVVVVRVNNTSFLLNDHNNDPNQLHDVQIFQRAKFNYPLHLHPIDPRVHLKHAGFESIDVVHRNGFIHMGSWIHVIDSPLTSDSEPRILMIKRKEDLVTCPGTWSLVGEHAYRDESPLDTVRRGLKEELGSRFLDYVDRFGSITKLMDLPVYFELDYGPSKIGRRTDKQVTYLWLVEVPMEKNVSGDAISSESTIEFDHEVADHAWKSLDEIKKLVKVDKHAFCHDKIISLMILGFRELQSKRESKRLEI